jgi:2-oxoglutarate ferredoxin oxidoreductase subunit alpha
MTAEAHAAMVSHLTQKIQRNMQDIVRTESYRMEDADIAIVSYGISARSSLAAVDEARELGIKAGLLRLITVWPFPEDYLRRLSETVRAFVTVEINLGQIHLEVQRCAAGRAASFLVGHAGGTVISPEQIVAMLKDVR